MVFKNILIPTDGSNVTQLAADTGLKIARSIGASVTALYVLDQSVYSNMPMDTAVIDVYDTLRKEGADATNYITERGREIGVHVEEMIIDGYPANTILKVCDDYDLVIMSTCGRTGMNKMLMGSVAEKVIRNAKVPIMIVRSDVSLPEEELLDQVTYYNILLPTDGSRNTNPAIKVAAGLANSHNAKITAMYVKGKSDSDEKSNDAIRIVKEIVNKDEAVTELVVSGKPAEAIIQESSKYDIIVMGTVGKAGMKKKLAGSVALAVMRESKCPVIIVRSEVDD